MGPMGFTHIGDWVGRGMSDDFREEFRRGNPVLPRADPGFEVRGGANGLEIF